MTDLQRRASKLFHRMLRSKSPRRRLMFARAYARCIDRILEERRKRYKQS